MKATVYNAVMATSWLMVSVGAGMVYVPAGLIVGGASLAGILLLTLKLQGR
jgi:hypothetical protein